MTERLYETDAYAQECEAQVVAVSDAGIVLDRTVFYARGGGQPGDTGRLIIADGEEIAVTDTLKNSDSDNLHVLAADLSSLPLRVGDRVTAVIDWERRYQHMRMHTCLHLLCALIDAPVTGGNLGSEKGRLDFDLPDASPDKSLLTEKLNALISADTRTELQWITDEELAAQPELVKTLSVQPPTGVGLVRLLKIDGVDLQPCGGTHVKQTGEIGPVRISKIEKKSRLNRRISVVFG